jgi:tetratricopeptide (TPR) repeat protein
MAWHKRLLGLAVLIATACMPVDSQQTGNAPLPDTHQQNTSIIERPVQALFRLELQAARTGWNDDVARQMGNLRRGLGDLSGAVAAWARIESPDAATLSDLARAQLALEEWSAAADTLRVWLLLSPDDPQASLQLALLTVSFDPASSLRLLEAAAVEPAYSELTYVLITVLRQYEDDPLLPLLVGRALAEQEQWVYAQVAFEHASQRFEPFPEALIYLALARTMQGKDGSAEAERAAALAPQDARVRYLQGVYLRAADAPLAAIDVLVQAIALDPQSAAYYAELAGAYRDVRELAQAERWLLMALEVSGGAARYREQLALFYADEAENLTSSGLEALEAALGLAADSADLKAGYGWALYNAGESERGRALIDEALASDPDNARARYYLARILIDSDAEAEAIPLLQEVVAGGGDFAPLARQLLDTMR